MTHEHGYTPAPEMERICQKEASRAYNRAGLGIFLFILVPQVIVLAVQLVVGMLTPDLLSNIYFLWGLQVVALYMTAAPIAILVIGKPSPLLPLPQKQKASPLMLGTVFCLMMTASVIGTVISTILMRIAEMITRHSYENTLDSVLNETPMPLIVLLVVIVGPLIEELVFRRALMDRLLPHGEISAILLSGITFGLMHGNFFQLFYTTAIGVLLAYVYARTRNLLYPLLLHMVFNFWGSVLPLAFLDGLPENLDTMTNEEMLAWAAENLIPTVFLMLRALAMYGMALAGFILVLVFIRHIRFEPCPLPLPRRGAWRIRFLNPGMILCFGLAILFLLISLIPPV